MSRRVSRPRRGFRERLRRVQPVPCLLGRGLRLLRHQGGGGLDFFASQDISINGPTPISPSGGNIGSGRTRFWMWTDTIQQIQGRAGERQIKKDARIGFCGGPMVWRTCSPYSAKTRADQPHETITRPGLQPVGRVRALLTEREAIEEARGGDCGVDKMLVLVGQGKSVIPRFGPRPVKAISLGVLLGGSSGTGWVRLRRS